MSLSRADDAEILRLWNGGASVEDIAEHFGVGAWPTLLQRMHKLRIPFAETKARRWTLCVATCSHCHKDYHYYNRTSGNHRRAELLGFCSSACLDASRYVPPTPEALAANRRAAYLAISAQRRAAVAEHLHFIKRLNVRKAIRVHDDLEADRAKEALNQRMSK